MNVFLQINSASTDRIVELANGIFKIKKINGKRLKFENFDCNNSFD